jgi:putative sigma-54 modulation protein
MQLDITFRNLRGRESVKARAEALASKLERFLDPAAEARLVISVEHSLAIVEMVIRSRGQTFKAKEENEDLRAAMDGMFHTMEGQLRRFKERRQEHRSRGQETERSLEGSGSV